MVSKITLACTAACSANLNAAKIKNPQHISLLDTFNLILILEKNYHTERILAWVSVLFVHSLHTSHEDCHTNKDSLLYVVDESKFLGGRWRGRSCVPACPNNQTCKLVEKNLLHRMVE